MGRIEAIALALVAVLRLHLAATATTTSTANATTESSVVVVPPNLPPARDWPHRPVFVSAGADTAASPGLDGGPLPLGVPFRIETPLFAGRVLVRFRHAPSDDPTSHDAYFAGRRRLMQTVVQGRFKRPGLRMSDVYVGTVFDRELDGPPPPYMTKILDAILRRVAPGLVLDLSSSRPRVLALLAGAAQTVSIDPPGEEPSMTAVDVEENVADVLGTEVGTASRRVRRLGHPRKASAYVFDTDHVYTFHTYDDAMDYGRGTMRVPLYGEYDLKPSVGRQPLSLTAVTAGGEILYDLRIWHESVQDG